MKLFSRSKRSLVLLTCLCVAVAQAENKPNKPDIVALQEAGLVGYWPFDSKRILFSFCDHSEQDLNRRRFLIYEIAIDGS